MHKLQKRGRYYHERRGNEKSSSTTAKEMPNEDKEKNAGIVVNQDPWD